MSFRGLILSVPTAFPTTNGKAMNIMIHPTIQKRRLGIGFRCWCWVVALLLPYGSTGCARVTPLSEPTPTDPAVDPAPPSNIGDRPEQLSAADFRKVLLRANRLALLARLHALFTRVADIARLHDA